MAVPMTSCMSEPTMASSMVSQRRVRGTCGEEVTLHQSWHTCPCYLLVPDGFPYRHSPVGLEACKLHVPASPAGFHLGFEGNN